MDLGVPRAVPQGRKPTGFNPSAAQSAQCIAASAQGEAKAMTLQGHRVPLASFSEASLLGLFQKFWGKECLLLHTGEGSWFPTVTHCSVYWMSSVGFFSDAVFKL